MLGALIAFCRGELKGPSANMSPSLALTYQDSSKVISLWLVCLVYFSEFRRTMVQCQARDSCKWVLGRLRTSRAPLGCCAWAIMEWRCHSVLRWARALCSPALPSPKAVSQGAPWVGWSHRQPQAAVQDPHHGQSKLRGGSVELGCGNTLSSGMWVCKSFCWSCRAPSLRPAAAPTGWRMMGPWVKLWCWYFCLSTVMEELSNSSNLVLCPEVFEIPVWKRSGAGQGPKGLLN